MMSEEFYKYLNDTKEAFDMWTDSLVKEALRQGGSYQKAINWLSNKMPDLPGQGFGTVEDQLNSAYRTVYEDAKKIIRQMALNKQVQPEDLEDGNN